MDMVGLWTGEWLGGGALSLQFPTIFAVARNEDISV